MSLTFNQVLRKRVKKKIKRVKFNVLLRSPMRAGTVVKVTTKSPCRPNSAKRRVVKVRIMTKKRNLNCKEKFKISYDVFVHIPGENHNLDVGKYIMVAGGNLQDTPGVFFTAIRGKLDLLGVEGRKSSRSKYGQKKQKNVEK